MKVESPDLLRNLALVGHNDTGKTTLASAILYTAGVTNRQNRVEDGNTTTDFDAEEIERGISIGLATCYAPWQRHKINLIDCPGYGIFLSEIKAGMQVADASLLCINSAAGLQVTSEKVWEIAESLEQPVILCLTKLDRENADFSRVVESLQESLDRMVLPIQIPIGAEADFSGVVDLVEKRAYRFSKDGDGKGSVEEVPAELASEVEEYRSKLVEAVAESDEALLEAYFEEGDLTDEQLQSGLKSAVAKRAIFPLLLSAASHGIGTSTLLDAVVSYAPSPAGHSTPPLAEGQEETEEGVAAIVFKTLNDPFSGKISLLRVAQGTVQSDTPHWNSDLEEVERVGTLMHMQGKQGEGVESLVAGDIGGVAKLKISKTGHTLSDKAQPLRLQWIDLPAAAMSFAIEPKSKGDEEKIGEALTRLVEEDPALEAGRDAQTGEFLLSGTGQLHVEIAVAKLLKRYKVEVILHPPKVPYRETIRRPAQGHGRHKKQTGGRGQFADCRITMEPLSNGETFEFVDEIFGGSIPQTYRPAVEKGIREAAQKGFLAGYPVVEFRVRLQDGQFHDVDSSEMAFKIAGSLAFKDAMEQAKPTLLEPMMLVEVTTTEEFMGDIMSDLSQRRGRPQGMEAKGSAQVVRAMVPLAEMLSYAPALRSMTQGRSSFTMEFDHYEEVPRNVQEKIIAEAKQAQEQAS